MFNLKKHQGPCELLSFQEERDLAWCVANPEICFNVSRTVLFAGSLDVERLTRAIARVAELHDGLRTRFPMRPDGGFVREVMQEAHCIPEVLDAGGASLEDPALEAAVLEFIERRIEIDAFPPFRVLLVRMADDRSLLAVSMAHQISDAVSGFVFVNELSAAYLELEPGRGQALSAPEFALSDYVRSHRAWMDSADYAEKLRALGERLLPGLRHLTEASGAWGSSQQKARRAAVIESDFPHGSYLDLLEIAKMYKVTLPAALHCLAVLALARVTGRRRMFVSFMLSNRHYPGAARIIGHLANAIPVYVDLEQHDSPRAFMSAANKEIFMLTAGFGCVPLGAVNQAVVGLDPLLSLKSPFNGMMINILAAVPVTSFAGFGVLPQSIRYAGFVSNEVQLNFLDTGGHLLQLCRAPRENARFMAAEAARALRDALDFALRTPDGPLSAW